MQNASVSAGKQVQSYVNGFALVKVLRIKTANQSIIYTNLYDKGFIKH